MHRGADMEGTLMGMDESDVRRGWVPVSRDLLAWRELCRRPGPDVEETSRNR